MKFIRFSGVMKKLLLTLLLTPLLASAGPMDDYFKELEAEQEQQAQQRYQQNILNELDGIRCALEDIEANQPNQ